MSIWTHADLVSGSHDNSVASLFEATIDGVLQDPSGEEIEKISWEREPCIYCGGMLTRLASSGSHLFSIANNDDAMVAELVVCQGCGWWVIAAADLELEIENKDWYALRTPTNWPRKYDRPSGGIVRARSACVSGCLAKFGDPAIGLSQSIEELQRLMLANPEARYMVKPSKFEAIVAQVFRDCGSRVIETGGSHDGGIDLLLYEGPENKVSAVQVKRYRSTIGVAIVRELRGAMQEAPDVAKGVIVTSSGFSRFARKSAARPGLKRIELVDGNRLLEMLGCHLRPAYCQRDLASAAFAEPWADIGSRLARESWSESELPESVVEELARAADDNAR